MSKPFTYPRPDWVRRINYMGESVGGAHHLIGLNADELLATAEQTTGLSDWGDDWTDTSLEANAGWREAFTQLVDCYDTKAGLNTLGRLGTKQELLRALRTRLMIVDAHRKDPTLADVAIITPVFIVGQSRTGTTIIHELTSLDENLRAPKAWEMIHPFELKTDTPRQQLAECEQDLFEDIVPEFAAVHELRAAIPMECLLMMGLEFDGGWAATTGNVDDFLIWRSNTNPAPAYNMHKRFLQVLQGHDPTPKTWLLKSPAHLMHLELLFKTYPDARIIHTHRDPAKTIASTISTVATSRFTRCDNIDIDTLAFTVPIGFQMALDGGIALRKQSALPTKQITDVLYHEFIDAPSAALAKAYAALNMPFDATLHQAMQKYLDEKPQGKHGKHHYALEDFGLNADELEKQFAAYVEYYGIKKGV